MATINADEFIGELIFCLKQEDVVKAKALLQFASDGNVDADIQRKALIELGKGPDHIVFPLLEFLTRVDISDPEIQGYLYDLILDKAYRNTRQVTRYILGTEKKTRLLFLKAAEDLLLKETAPSLEQILAQDRDPDILSAAISALGKLRIPETLSVLTAMAAHSDTQVRREAVFAIAEHGNDAAVDQLIRLIGRDEETNKLAVDALTDIQTIYSLDQMTSLLESGITNVRDTAIDQLIKLGNKATPILARASRNATADYLVHLITTLGYIGDPTAIPAILDIINTQPADPNIRQAAYEAMERIPSPKTAISLVQGLQDPEESVRMSAARAIDKNLSKALVAGLKNVVREGSQDSRNVVAALIDSDSTNIFKFLVEEESFLTLAETYLTVGKAAPSIRKGFLKQMAVIGQKTFVESLTGKLAGQSGPKEQSAQIVVIDDSKMMLKLYQNKLSAIGLQALTFDRPEEAIPQILTKKPDLVITDLNMPNISGLELTREIRKKFSRKDIPILMITTQSDFIEEKDGDIKVNDKVLTQSGINLVLHKPFTDEAFQKAIKRFISF